MALLMWKANPPIYKKATGCRRLVQPHPPTHPTIITQHGLSWHGEVFTSIIKCGMKLHINSQTSTMEPLKFGSWYVISSDTLWCVLLFIHARVKLIRVSRRGSWTSIMTTYTVLYIPGVPQRDPRAIADVCIKSRSLGMSHEISTTILYNAGENSCQYADDFSNYIFFKENRLKSISCGPIDNNSRFVWVMDWCRPGDRPLPESMMAQFTNAYMRHLYP